MGVFSWPGPIGQSPTDPGPTEQGEDGKTRGPGQGTLAMLVASGHFFEGTRPVPGPGIPNDTMTVKSAPFHAQNPASPNHTNKGKGGTCRERQGGERSETPSEAARGGDGVVKAIALPLRRIVSEASEARQTHVGPRPAMTAIARPDRARACRA